MMHDIDIARIVTAKLLLAKPEDRENVIATQIPLDKFARVLPLIPVVMAGHFDELTKHDKRKRLQFEGILRTFIQATKE